MWIGGEVSTKLANRNLSQRPLPANVHTYVKMAAVRLRLFFAAMLSSSLEVDVDRIDCDALLDLTTTFIGVR